MNSTFLYKQKWLEGLTLNLLNLLNGLVLFSMFGTIHYQFCGYKEENLNFVSSIEPVHTAQTCRVAWLYTGGKG